MQKKTFAVAISSDVTWSRMLRTDVVPNPRLRGRTHCLCNPMMALPQPTVLLPETPIGEWNAFGTHTVTGLFAYRQAQAMELLDLPDFGGGDLDAAQRKEALKNAVAFQRPLAALALFLGVVALEDLVRDLGGRLAAFAPAVRHFPALAQMAAQPRPRAAAQAFRRLDTDPAGCIDPEEINSIYKKALGIEPVPASEFWHLRDLALLRHTVAHHAAMIRVVDVPRFAHFIVRGGALINPPPDFVRSECMYLFKLGREIEKCVRLELFSKVIAATGPGWAANPPLEVIELIEFFGFFGFIEVTNAPVGYLPPGHPAEAKQKEEAVRIRAALIRRCIDELSNKFGA